MKRLFVALSTLALLLVAVPASAAQTTPASLCKAERFPDYPLQLLRDEATAEQWTGKLCLKMCKAHFAACKKIAIKKRQCYVTASKALQQQETNECQLRGGEKKTCTQDAKVQFKLRLGFWKEALFEDHLSCNENSAGCKAACAP